METTKRCPYCGEEILAVAIKCKHCGSSIDADANPSQSPRPQADYGWVILGIPIAALVLMWTWVTNLSLLQGPGSALAMISALVLICTAAACAFEASKLGMRSDRKKGIYSPAGWAMSVLFLWVVAYPIYLFKRRKFGVSNLLFPGLFVAAIYLASVVYLFDVIDEKEAEIRGSLQKLQSPFNLEGRQATAPSVEASPATTAPKDSDSAPTSNTAASQASTWSVELGIFSKRENAERLVFEAQAKGFNVGIANSKADSNGLYHVQAMGLADGAAAKELQERLQASGLPAAVLSPGPESGNNAADMSDAVPVTTANAADGMTFDTKAYCRAMGDSIGGSNTLELSCRKEEAAARASIEKITIPDRTKAYCTQMAQSIGGSYTLLKSCIEEELKAKGAL